MKRLDCRAIHLALLLALFAVPPAAGASPGYLWLEGASSRNLERAFPPPQGFERLPVAPDSYGAWLRRLPLKPGGTPVITFDGRQKAIQQGVAAVVDIDIGTRDLQQCADAAIRLRAEYLYAKGAAPSFKFISGDAFPYKAWLAGKRPKIAGNRVAWVRTGRSESSRRQFRRWLDVIFTYAGTASVARDTRPIDAPREVRPGDLLVQGGFPGHALTVVDTAIDARGRRAVLLAQSYMPAQSLHVVRNLRDPGWGAWYLIDEGAVISTPDWRPFPVTAFRRWPGA